MLIKTFAATLALCQNAQAAFFWYPQYLCIEDHICAPTKSKRSVAAAAFPGVVGFEVVQTLPKRSDLPHETRIRRLADRLARKYQRDAPPQPFEEGHDVVKKDNRFTISTATVPSQPRSAGIDQDGADYSYFATVKLGTSNIDYHMLLDTGAGQSWVMGDTCESTACTTHSTFGPGDSTSYQAVDKAFTIAYGTGNVAGMFATDSVSIAGLSLNMTFGVANMTSSDFDNFPIDGILGLNQFSYEYPTFVQTLTQSKLLQSNIFGISLNRAKDGPNNGEINFGAPDTSRFSGSLSYTPVGTNAAADWAIPIDDIGVGSQKSGISGKLAYIDTGTSFIFAEPQDVATFHALIQGSFSTDGSTYYVPCTTTDSAFFVFSGVTYEVSALDWVGSMVNGHCTSNIYGMAVVPGAWLVGDTFLKNVYAVFDIDQNRVGLASRNGASLAPSASSSSGGPVSSSAPTSAVLPSSAGANPGSSTGPLGTQSNRSQTGSSTSAGPSPTENPVISTAGTPNPSATVPPGMDGHQTAGTSGTAAAESSSTSAAASPPTTQKGAAVHLNSSHLPSLLALLALLTLLT